MRLNIAAVLITALAAISSTAIADETLASYQWTNRPVIIFADSPRDPRFVEQMADFATRTADIEERDVVLLTDTDPAAKGPLRKQLRPRGFQLILIGKDGQIKLRTPHPIEVDALNRHIDRMPMRKREMEGGQD
ncbi:MAG: DUF4174 domain-containing protein [Pikeienuella sp.]